MSAAPEGSAVSTTNSRMHALSCLSGRPACQGGSQDRAEDTQLAVESCQGLADHLDLHIALMHPVIAVMGVAGAGMAALRVRIEIDAGDDEALRAQGRGRRHHDRPIGRTCSPAL